MSVSFARTVKEEIVFNDFDECCQKAILSAIIKINGTLSLSNQGLLLTIRTENAKIASKVHKMLKEVYDPQIEFFVSRKMKLKKNNVYILKVSKAREILEDLGLMNGMGFQQLPDKKLVKKSCCQRAFLAGVFLSSGSVNNPETSNYHLEISVNEEEYAQFIQQLMNRYHLNAKHVKRRNKYIVYIKSAEKIGDFLRAVGASQSVMSFENTRIERNMSNTFNRLNNCDIANDVKSMVSSNKQLEDINVVEMFKGIDVLDEKTKNVVFVRRKYPELTLSELCDAYYKETGETISKSGLHHRFKKIHDMAEELMQMQGE